MSPLLLLAAASSAPELTICADRPSKANGACTVPAMHWQLEVSALDWAHSPHSDVTSGDQAMVKLGISGSSDIELGFAPFVSVHEPGPDSSGIGDVVVRYKQRLTARDAQFQAAVIPFLKLPAASHSIGNGKFEGGLAVPLSAPLGPFTATLGPEVDLLADSDRNGHHLAVTNVLNLGWSAAPRLNVAAELWTNADRDPAGTVRRWSADASTAYLISPRMQWDAGVNLGLNRYTPDVELYCGLSLLF